MKALAYALFKHPSAARFEWRAFVRGMAFNCRMNRLLYPGWDTVLFIDQASAARYGELFEALGAKVTVRPDGAPLCEAMLWRMLPVFGEPRDYTHVLCRDADAITTYREACAVAEWLASGRTAHALHDNPAHASPLMGGMCGFDCRKLRAATGFASWAEMIAACGDLSGRGSDQEALAARIYPRISGDTFRHDLTGGKTVDARPDGVHPRLWQSDLTCRHIGSAGVVEMETIRFFRRFDPLSFDALEARYPEVFYWHG
jgi:hypothetical protein